MDFTQTTYKTLLETLKKKHYKFATFQEHLHSINSKGSGDPDLSGQPFNHSVLLLRHDVDRLPQNSLKLAQIEHSLGIKGTYYFRVVPESYDLEIINKIASLGHEIGYHYEDVDLVVRSQKSDLPTKVSTKVGVRSQNEANTSKGKHTNIQTYNHSNIIDAAYESFCKNLEIFRKNFDIKTICMHGSPRSPYDNKLIWQKYDYRELGIIGTLP